MSLQQIIKGHTKEAMIAKDELKTLVLRGVQAEIQRYLLANNPSANEGTDEEVLTIIKRIVKQRKDSIEQFTKGGRPDLAENELKELKILETYLPEMMSLEDVVKFAKTKKDELGVMDKSGAGKLIGIIAKDLKGKADGSVIKQAVDGLFS